MKIKKILFAIPILFFTACNYLDIVPDEVNTEFNMFENPTKAKQYLYSCYAYLPNPRLSEALDKFTAAEIAWADEKNDWQKFIRGYYSPSSPSLANTHWETCYTGIKQCYSFLSVVDKTPNIEQEDLQYYKAEATLLVAYYHWLLLKAFGPIIIMEKNYSYLTPIEELPERSSYDKCVEFIDKKIKEAEEFGLYDDVKQENTDYGRLTKYCALALRSRMYLYAASELFNSDNNGFYNNFKSKTTGENLMPLTKDDTKWAKAVEASKEALDAMEGKFRLFDKSDVSAIKQPMAGNAEERAVRYTFMENSNGANPEVIWVDTRQEGVYAIQNQSAPYQQKSNGNKNSWNLVAPTLQMVELFLTKNGLPIEEDTEYDYDNRYGVGTITATNLDGNTYTVKGKEIVGGKTMNLNLNRENRFYAWIGFHNGPYEITKCDGVATGATKYIKLEMQMNDLRGYHEGDQTNYSITGYLNKKFVHPNYQTGPVQYPYPTFRLAEIYLNYAEALIEVGGDANLSLAKEYIDKVRVRAGVPKIDVAWKKARHPEKANTQDGLREIVRQERQIEFYLENQRFWDLRRWKKAEILGEKAKGMNIKGATDEDFFKVTDVQFIRTFKPAQYLMPIPISETNKCPQIVQNPGYLGDN